MDCLVSDCKYKSNCEKENCISFIPEGCRLKDIKFNNIKHICKGISISKGNKIVSEKFIGEVLPEIINYANYKVKSCHTFFDLFVIQLEEN